MVGKSNMAFREAILQALSGKEVLYCTPKGNVVVRAVDKDKELLNEIREEAVRDFIDYMGLSETDMEMAEQYLDDLTTKEGKE